MYWHHILVTYKIPTFVTLSPVWNDSKIMVGKKSLFIKYLYEKGVETVNDF